MRGTSPYHSLPGPGLPRYMMENPIAPVSIGFSPALYTTPSSGEAQTDGVCPFVAPALSLWCAPDRRRPQRLELIVL